MISCNCISFLYGYSITTIGVFLFVLETVLVGGTLKDEPYFCINFLLVCKFCYPGPCASKSYVHRAALILLHAM
jgi:hypothetical protein